MLSSKYGVTQSNGISAAFFEFPVSVRFWFQNLGGKVLTNSSLKEGMHGRSSYRIDNTSIPSKLLILPNCLTCSSVIRCRKCCNYIHKCLTCSSAMGMSVLQLEILESDWATKLVHLVSSAGWEGILSRRRNTMRNSMGWCSPPRPSMCIDCHGHQCQRSLAALQTQQEATTPNHWPLVSALLHVWRHQNLYTKWLMHTVNTPAA